MLSRSSASRGVGALLMLLAMAGAEASSYMYSESEANYTATLSQLSATQTWDPQGDLQDIGCRSERTGLQNQFEYGYSYYYTLFSRLGLAKARCGAASRTGLGDLDIGVRGRINPYKNYRSWELDLTIPTHGRQTGHTQIGCGVYGLGANVDRSDVISPWLTAGYGTGVKFWQAPLGHQLHAQAQLTGPIGERGFTPWFWYSGLTYLMPLSDRPTDPVAAANDCGTQAQVIRTTTQLKYRYSREITLGCGYEAALWGEDISRSSGFSCSYSYLWH